MTHAPKIFLTSILLVMMPACSWIDNYDRNEKYLEAESIPRVDVPAELDKPTFVDVMEIPEVDDARGIQGQKVAFGLPEPLSTTFGVEQIVLKKLGDSRWIFLDAPPATVWPKIIQFWQEHNLEIQDADPRQGVMESTWITTRTGDAAEVFESLKSGVGWADSSATIQNKFRLTIEPGIRTGSSEVYLEHKQVPLNAPVRPDSANWTGLSDDLLLEAEVLTKLAYYLGEKIHEPVISVMAIENRAQKAELIPDRVKPVLRYRLDFNRAWATVGDALDNARIPIEDLDRTSQVYYINYDESVDLNPGFLAKIFNNDEIESNPANRYLVHLDSDSEDVLVTILKDPATPADAGIAERLLKIIKESST